MNHNVFKDRIRKKQWSQWHLENDMIDEWWHTSGEDTFLEIGEKLLKLGASHEEALDILGDCRGAVEIEYGD